MDREDILRVARVDIWYGVLAGAIILVGFWRAIFAAKGWAYYSVNLRGFMRTLLRESDSMDLRRLRQADQARLQKNANDIVILAVKRACLPHQPWDN
jgi:hypothetical protein